MTVPPPPTPAAAASSAPPTTPSTPPASASTRAELPTGQPYAVMNLQGRVFMSSCDDPFRKADDLLARSPVNPPPKSSSSTSTAKPPPKK